MNNYEQLNTVEQAQQFPPHVLLDDRFTPADLDELVNVSDADGVYTMLEDYGFYESSEYIATKYFA